MKKFHFTVDFEKPEQWLISIVDKDGNRHELEGPAQLSFNTDDKSEYQKFQKWVLSANPMKLESKHIASGGGAEV